MRASVTVASLDSSSTNGTLAVHPTSVVSVLGAARRSNSQKARPGITRIEQATESKWAANRTR